MLSKLVIKVSSFEPNEDYRAKIITTLDDLARANATMREATKSILSWRTRFKQYALHLLCLQFYLGDESNSIVQAVGYAMENLMVGVAEFEILTKQKHAHCTKDDVLFHGQQLMALFGVGPNAFGGLTCLKLDKVRLNGPDMPLIFSICKRLEFLRLHNCSLGTRCSS